MMALLGYLQIGVAIVYLDGNPGLQIMPLPADIKPEFSLLYRPGHYDII